jgi:hypothetical protein
MNCFRSRGTARLRASYSVDYLRLLFCFVHRSFIATLRLAVCVSGLITIQIFGLANAQPSDDDSLRIYAVNVAKNPPFKKEFIGYGIYLGQGTVITAAHVVGHWPFFTRPRVLIAGLDLPAKVLKISWSEQIDLALLSVDETQLPVSLRLRRNPLCQRPPLVGMEVIDVIPETTSRSRIISPLLIEPSLRNIYDTLVDDVEASGSGIFDAQRKCLLGIASAKVVKFKNQKINGRVAYVPTGFAGYFVSAAKIAKFLPEDLHL